MSQENKFEIKILKKAEWMTINIPAYKYIQNEQNINFSNGNICTLIGENGSGKSTI